MPQSRTFLHLLQQREEILGKIYILFATSIEEDALFWSSLAKGKRERVRLLAPYVEQAESGKIICAIHDKNYDNFVGFIDELSTMQSYCSMHFDKLSTKIMVELTLYLEHISEQQSQIPLKELNSPQVHKVLREMSQELDLGLEAVDGFARNYSVFYSIIPHSLGDFRRILQPVKALINELPEELDVQSEEFEQEPEVMTTSRHLIRPQNFKKKMSEFFVDDTMCGVLLPSLDEIEAMEREESGDEGDEDLDDYEAAYNELKVKYASIEREVEYLRKEIEALRNNR